MNVSRKSGLRETVNESNSDELLLNRWRIVTESGDDRGERE